MKYEIWEEVEDEGMHCSFETDFRNGAFKVAHAMVECAKNDGYDYLIKIVNSETGEEEKVWDSLGKRRYN